MTAVLQVDRLEGQIRYVLRLPAHRTEALQHEILHPVDPHAFEMARDRLAAVAGAIDTRTFQADARTTGAILERILVPPPLRRALAAVEGPLLISTSLAGIPWELLYDGESFWGTRFALGRQLVSGRAFTLRTEPVRHPRRRALVIGAHHPGNTLPMLDAEVEGLVASLAGRLDVVCLAGPLATAAAIVDQLRDGFDLIHFCGHTVNDQGAGPALLAVDGRLLTASLLYASTTGRPLVVLNACSSAVSDGGAAPPREDVAWGLADAFLQAGATGAVGPLRAVADRHALDVSRHFYAAVLAGVPIGEALRRCREHALAIPPEGIPSWLAFVLYGNPELSLADGRDASASRARSLPAANAPSGASELLHSPDAGRDAVPAATHGRFTVLWLGLLLLVVAVAATVPLLLREHTASQTEAMRSRGAGRATAVVAVRTPEGASTAWPAHQAFLRESFDRPAEGSTKYNGVWDLGTPDAYSSMTVEDGRLCIVLSGSKDNVVRTLGIGTTKRRLGKHPLSVAVEVQAATSGGPTQAGLGILDDDNRMLAFATTTEDGMIHISARPEVTGSFEMLFEGHAPSFVPDRPNKLAWTSSGSGLTVYVNDALVRRVALPRPLGDSPRVGMVAIGPGRSCFDDFVVYRPGHVIGAKATPAAVPGRETSSAWRLLDPVYEEFFHLRDVVSRDPESGQMRYDKLWRIDPAGKYWAREVVDGAYCFTNESKAARVDWVSLRIDDRGFEISELPITTEVKVEPGRRDTDAGGGLIVHLHGRGKDKSYVVYTIDQRGTLRLQRRTKDGGFRLLYSGSASPFNAGRYNLLGIRSSPAGFELYVNDVLQERVLPDGDGQPNGGSAGPAAFGIGRFCFEGFTVLDPEGRSTGRRP